MKIDDIVYGQHEVTEPVLLELIGSAPVQRLKGVAQFGLPDAMYHRPGFSRYEHSIGVLLLLRYLKADLTEQVAGLLHDVSHTAFSHVIDWAIGDPTRENFQDDNHQAVIARSAIPLILKRHGFAAADIDDLTAHTLLEREAPDLCADRVDYTLRELAYQGEIDIIATCIKALAVREGKIIFTSQQAAELFGEAYLTCQREHWSGEEAQLRYQVLAEIIREGLRAGIITRDDFWLDDEAMIAKLQSPGNPTIDHWFHLLTNEPAFTAFRQGHPFKTQKKRRFVDPEFTDGARLTRLSTASPSYATLLSTV